MTASVILAASRTSKTAGGTGTRITSTLATRLTGRTKSCQRPNADVRPVFVAIPVAIHDSGDSTSHPRDDPRHPARLSQDNSIRAATAAKKSNKTRGGKVSQSPPDVQPETGPKSPAAVKLGALGCSEPLCGR